MGRKPRAELDGAIYHVTQRGNGGQTIFRSDAERRSFLKEVAITADRYRWEPLAYCLMSNHYHLVIETRDATLGAGMRRLGSVHAQAFNRRAATYGHVFQERFGSVQVRTDAQFVQLLRYVAFNPVTAGICRDPTEWTWSSHRSVLTTRGECLINRRRVEDLLEAWGGSAGARYAKLFATDGERSAELCVPDGGLHRPPLEALLSLPPSGGAIHVARDYGYLQSEIADVLGVSQPTISRCLRESAARAGSRLRRDE